MTKTAPPPLFLALLGPTAVGKSDLALVLAERLGTGILSADSMQVYRGMDIGTAKPTPEERAQVPHHLIDVADPHQTFSVSDYLELATPILLEHWESKKPLVICGGTGLYFKALSEGLAESPPPDFEFRTDLEERADREGTSELYREFVQTDPEAAAKVHPNDRKRIIRALEIHHQTGLTKTAFEASQNAPAWQGAFRWLGLRREWEDLDERINRRVAMMLEQGLEAEVRALLEAGLNRKCTAMQALGYKEMAEYLAGVRTLQETSDLIQQRTRRFARRQMSWFRSMPQIEWHPIPSDENRVPASSSALAGAMLASLG